MAFHKHLVLAAAALLAGSAQAATTYDRIYVFGDSLVDSGNGQIGSAAMHLDDPSPATSGYFSGRFSNGTNYADDLSQMLGKGPALAYLSGGTNYAVGGASTAPLSSSIPHDPKDDLIPDFAQQITLYEESLTGNTPSFYPKDTRPAIDANSLVVVNFGGNDIRNFLKYGTPDLADSLTDFGKGLGELITDGARNIVVVGLPDIGKIPSVVALGPTVEDAGTKLSYGLNSGYEKAAGIANQGLAGTGSVSFFDLFAFQDTAEALPTSFGLNSGLLTHDCVDDGAQAGGCAGYLFFDGIHPTAQVHGLIANAIATQVGILPAPEAATWMLMIIGFGGIGAALRRQRMVPATAQV